MRVRDWLLDLAENHYVDLDEFGEIVKDLLSKSV